MSDVKVSESESESESDCVCVCVCVCGAVSRQHSTFSRAGRSAEYLGAILGMMSSMRVTTSSLSSHTAPTRATASQSYKTTLKDCM